MRRKFSERAFGRGYQLAGSLLMMVSAVSFLGTAVGRAQPFDGFTSQLGTVVAALVPTLATPEPEPSPSPQIDDSAGVSQGLIPTAAPSAPPRVRHGGPLEYSITGSVSVGDRSSSTVRYDPDTGTLVSGTGETDSSVGMTVDLRRRTTSTTLEYQQPIGFSNVGTQAGVGILSYSTPRYTLGYASLPVGLLGQLTLGSTYRGPYLTLPLTNGDVTFFSGPTGGVNLEGIHIGVVRARKLYGRALVELGLAQSTYGPLTGTSSTLFGGVAYAKGTESLISEFAYQDRDAPDAQLHLFSSQLRLDDATYKADYSLTLRDLPERLLSFGAGELYGDKLIDVAYRSSARSDANIDVALEKSDYNGSDSEQRRTLAQYELFTGAIGYQFSVQDQRLISTGVQWTGLGGFTINAPIRNGFAVAGVQLGRSTQTDTSPIGSALFNLTVNRSFGAWGVATTLLRQHQSSDQVGSSKLSSNTIALERTFGKASLGLQYQDSLTQSPLSDAHQWTPTIIVGRQLSPALTAQLQYGIQHLVDPLNPSSNGTTKNFSVLLNAPFSVGTSLVQGRVDPRLPAVIEGKIVSDLGNNAALAGLVEGGLGNIVVILDNTVIQRSDLQGNFQFSFVTPGQHQIRVETSSLPRGYTVDQPITTLNIQGGQTAQVYLRVGDFGGIVGHVFGTDANGQKIPLAGVQLRIDGGVYSLTDQQGTYGFGRLLAGQHTIEVIENTVPAYATFSDATRKKQVDVNRGQVANVDFVGDQLGSIAGRVVFDESLAPNYTGAVNNAYVVAEPGEHAAITNDDGSFLIDNLPPGDYTVSVDNETVPEDTGMLGDPIAVTLKGNDQYHGALFLVGHAQKKVVFSLLSGGSAPASMRILEKRLPPGGASDVNVSAPADAHSVFVNAFGTDQPLSFDKKKKEWVGTISIPDGTKDGPQTIAASINESSGAISNASATVTVDSKLPPAILQLVPANAAIGSYVGVRARFLIDVHEGDKILWDDGQVTTLGKPIVGHVFTFSLKFSARPLRGVLQVKPPTPLSLQ